MSESLGTSIGAEWRVEQGWIWSTRSDRWEYPEGCPLVRLGYCKSRTKTPMVDLFLGRRATNNSTDRMQATLTNITRRLSPRPIFCRRFPFVLGGQLNAANHGPMLIKSVCIPAYCFVRRVERSTCSFSPLASLRVRALGQKTIRSISSRDHRPTRDVPLAPPRSRIFCSSTILGFSSFSSDIRRSMKWRGNFLLQVSFFFEKNVRLAYCWFYSFSRPNMWIEDYLKMLEHSCNSCRYR